MPEIDGFEFIHRLKKIDKDRATPVIVLTAKDLARQELEALNATAQSIVHKGSGSVEALLAEVKSCLAAGHPAVRVEVAPDAPLAVQSNGKGGVPRVLVVDDEENELKWLRTTLTEAGYLVDTAMSGSAALELLQNQIFAAVTVDLMLPDMSGWELIRQLREGPNKDTPVLIASVHADKALGLGVPVHNYLLKPIQPSRLIASLAAAGAAPHSGHGILVIDDDAKTAKLLEPVLREWGYQPTFAESGAEGLKLIQDERPDAVILDLLMPEMSGFEFLDRLRSENANRTIPVIVMSYKDLSREEVRQVAAMAQSFVQKGVGSTLDMLEALRECAPIPAQMIQGMT